MRVPGMSLDPNNVNASLFAQLFEHVPKIIVRTDQRTFLHRTIDILTVGTDFDATSDRGALQGFDRGCQFHLVVRDLIGVIADFMAIIVKDGAPAARTFVSSRARTCSDTYAVENAAKDHDGKPIFYVICRHVSRSGMSRTISVHYFDTETGSMRHLNYVAAALLDRSQDSLRDGVICKGCGMDMGFDLVYALSYAATGDGYAVNHHWL